MRSHFKPILGFLLLLGLNAFGQNPPLNVTRSSPAVVANDARVKASLNLSIPVVADTSHGLNGGLDSLGLVIQVRTTGLMYIRDTAIGCCHKWTLIGSGASATIDSLIWAKRAWVYHTIDSMKLINDAKYVANSFGAKFLGADIWANRPPAVNGPGIFLSIGPDSTGFWYTNGVAYTRMTTDPGKLFNLYVRRKGQPGDTTLTAADSSLYSAAQRDSAGSCVHHVVNPDGSWTWYTTCGTGSAFDSLTAQGGVFHTGAYNDGRYRTFTDTSYAHFLMTRAWGYKISDSIFSVMNTALAAKISDSGFAVLIGSNGNVPIKKTTSGSARFIIGDTTATNPGGIVTQASRQKLLDSINLALRATLVANGGAAKSITVGAIGSRPAASNCQCFWMSTTDSSWSYDNGAWIPILPGIGNGINGTFGSSTQVPRFTLDHGIVTGVTNTGISFPSILFRYNVVDFGADSTGNNATVTRRAIDTCAALAMRSPFPAAVVFPSGVYAIDSSLIPITKSIAFEGFNAYIWSSNTNAFTFLTPKADSIRLKGLKFFGHGSSQKGVDINGFKYFSIRDAEFSNLAVGLRFANTSATYSAGDIDGVNFFNNIIGIFSDTLGEYVSVRGGLYTGNSTAAIQDDGGNNIYIGGNSNNNAGAAFKFTGGSNNSHGMILGWNCNHNGTSLDVSGANFGETVVGSHFYEGNFKIINSSNWRFMDCIIGASTLTLQNNANIDFSNTVFVTSYGTARNISGNVNRPRFKDNFGDISTNVGGAVPTITPGVDSIGGYGYRFTLTSDSLDLGIAQWQTKTLSADDTIRKIYRPTVGKIYRLEVIPNGHNFVLYDNTKIDGTYNPSAAINIFYLDCIDDGPDPRFLVSVRQPGIMVVRNSNYLGWGRLNGTATIAGPNITKTGPDATGWTVFATADKTLIGDGYVQFQTVTGNDNIMFGLATNPVQSTYTTIKYAIYIFATNSVDIAENGSLTSTSEHWANGDLFRVKVTGTTVTYEHSTNAGSTWSTFFTSSVAASPSVAAPLLPQFCVRGLTTLTGTSIFGTYVINSLQSYFAVQYPDTMTATSSPYRLISDTSGTNSSGTRGYIGKVRDSLALLISGGSGSSIRIFSATASGTAVTNTTTSTPMSGTGVGSKTILANTLSVGQTITMHGWFQYSTGSSNTQIGIVFTNSTGGAANPFNLPVSQTNDFVEFTMTGTILSTGSSGSISFIGTAFVAGVAKVICSSAGSTINTTVNQTFDASAVWTTASASNSINMMPLFTICVQ